LLVQPGPPVGMENSHQSHSFVSFPALIVVTAMRVSVPYSVSKRLISFHEICLFWLCGRTARRSYLPLPLPACVQHTLVPKVHFPDDKEACTDYYYCLFLRDCPLVWLPFRDAGSNFVAVQCWCPFPSHQLFCAGGQVCQSLLQPGWPARKYHGWHAHATKQLHTVESWQSLGVRQSVSVVNEHCNMSNAMAFARCGRWLSFHAQVVSPALGRHPD